MQVSPVKIHPKNSYEFTYCVPVGTGLRIRYLDPSMKSNVCAPAAAVVRVVPY